MPRLLQRWPTSVLLALALTLVILAAGIIVSSGKAPADAAGSGNTISAIGPGASVVDPVIDPDGDPIVAFSSNYGTPFYEVSQLGVLHCGNASCTAGNITSFPLPTSDTTHAISIALGANGNPVIYYAAAEVHYIGEQVYFGPSELRLINCGNSNCTAGNTITTLAIPGPSSSNYLSGIKLLIDGSGNPVVLYSEVYNVGGPTRDYQTFLLRCGNSTCTSGNTLTTVFDGEVPVNFGLAFTFTLDNSGKPVLAYGIVPGGDLVVVHCGNPACTSGNTSAVAGSGSAGAISGLALDSLGRPVLGLRGRYYNPQTGYASDAKVLRCGNANCSAGNTVTTIDGDTGDSGWIFGMSLALDSADHPVLAYLALGSVDGGTTFFAQLRVARCGDPACSSINISTFFPDSDEVCCSVGMDIDSSSNAVVAYLDEPYMAVKNSTLKVLHCGNPTCKGLTQIYEPAVLPPEAANGGCLGALLGGSFSPCSDEPVNLATGNYVYQNTDVSISSKGLPLAFARAYNSVGITGGRLGYGWQDNLNARLLFDNSDHAIANVTVVQADGRQDAYTRQGDGSYQPTPGIFDVLTRNSGDGSFTLQRKDRSASLFDSNGILQSIEERNGNTTTLTYSFGLLTTVTDPSGRTLAFAYDGSGRITSVTDPLSRVTTYSYDGNGNLASVTDPENGVTGYTYDANHQMLTITDPRGHVIMTNVYTDGKVSQQTNALGKTWTFSYGFGQTTETDPKGCATVHAYDGYYRAKQQIDCLGGVTAYAYDGYGNRNSVTDPLSHATSMTYDAQGNLLTSTDALGNTTSFTYNAQDDLLTRTDALGNVTVYTYDANGNLLSSTDALSGVSSFTYDAAGLLQTATDPLGHTSSLSYDSNGYPASATNPLSQTTSFARDAGGRLLSRTDPLNHTITYTHDDLDRLLTLTDALGHTTSKAYDPNGNKTSITDANGKTTSYTYDALDRLTSVIDSGDGTTSYGYDDVGNRTSMTDASGHTTTFAYDLLTRPISTTDPEGHLTSYTYDAAGNQVSRTDANASTANYTYDALNRLIKVTYTGQPAVSFTYNALGDRLSMTDQNGTTTYAYDDLNRLTSVTRPGSATVGYGYNLAGNRTSLTYPDGKVVAYAYDAADRLDTVTDWASRVTSYSYDDASRLTGADLPNGVHSARTYDDADRLVSIAHTDGPTSLISANYAVDDAGNRLSRAETVGTDATMTDGYGYDDLYRLTSVNYGNPSDLDQTYAYDPVGNRDELIEGSTTTGYTYDDADRLLTAGSTTYAFNANGNQTRAGSRSFKYDRENRLVQVADWTSSPNGTCVDVDGDGVTRVGDILTEVHAYFSTPTSGDYTPAKDLVYSGKILVDDILAAVQHYFEDCTIVTASLYDGDGLRTMVTQNGSTERLTWDAGAGLPVVLQQSQSGVTTSYVQGLELIASVQGATPTYYLQDGLGSTVALTDSNGDVTATYRYGAFGSLVASTGSADQPFRFTGQMQDGGASDDPYYLRARFYDPGTGRFLSQDPFAGLARTPQLLNRYPYVLNNPATYTDPTGLLPCFGPAVACKLARDAVDFVWEHRSTIRCAQSVVVGLANPALFLPAAAAICGYADDVINFVIEHPGESCDAAVTALGVGLHLSGYGIPAAFAAHFVGGLICELAFPEETGDGTGEGGNGHGGQNK